VDRGALWRAEHMLIVSGKLGARVHRVKCRRDMIPQAKETAPARGGQAEAGGICADPGAQERHVLIIRSPRTPFRHISVP
jgi:hypothetical protein